MNKRVPLFILPAVLILTSCAASLSRNGEYGTVSVAIGGSQNRALESGWVGGELPVFGSVAVKVSGSDMSDITATGSPSSPTITLKVPAGSSRLVEVIAVPAAGSTAPYFAAAYGGSAMVDIREGETTSVPITLSLAATKILLPDFLSGCIYTADSITGSKSSSSFSELDLEEFSDFEFDQYGRLFFSKLEGGTQRSTSFASGFEALPNASEALFGLAYQRSSNLLFYVLEPYLIGYTDVSGATTGLIEISETTEAIALPVIAADEGALYTLTADSEILDRGEESLPAAFSVTKISLAGTSITGIQHMPTSALGIPDGAFITDMIVKDGVLYITAAQLNVDCDEYSDYTDSSFSRGKIVALNTTDLAPLWDAGWAGDENNFPTDANKQLYGPFRFVGIAPKKLYVADDGFYWNGTTGNDHWVNKSRVIELDLDAKAITATGLEDAVDFFEAGSASYVNYQAY